MQFHVEGMTCQHCVRAVTRAIQDREPGAQVSVDLPGKTVTVEGAQDADAVRAAIEQEGYTVSATH